EQLSTWVSFRSAEQPLLGQFSVSGNTVINASSRPLNSTSLNRNDNLANKVRIDALQPCKKTRAP
ncbi:MAG: hypothetical protein DI546_14620, partial [Rhizobium sp.]